MKLRPIIWTVSLLVVVFIGIAILSAWVSAGANVSFVVPFFGLIILGFFFGFVLLLIMFLGLEVYIMMIKERGPWSTLQEWGSYLSDFMHDTAQRLDSKVLQTINAIFGTQLLSVIALLYVLSIIIISYGIAKKITNFVNTTINLT